MHGCSVTSEIMVFLALTRPQNDLMPCPSHLTPFKAPLRLFSLPFISFAVLPNVRVLFLSLNQKQK